jgi:hypothetical protein
MISPRLAPLGAAALLALAASAVPGAALAETVPEWQMSAHCRGEAAAKFGANPRYIEAGEVERAKHGFRVVGNYEDDDGTHVGFRCRYDAAGRLTDLTRIDHGGNRPSARQIAACNDMYLGTGKVLEVTPLKPGAFELIMKWPDGNFVCDVEASGRVTYFEKLK